MSNTDSFIEEVSEEVRRDKLFDIFRRYGWIALIAVLALVGGAAWTEYQKATARASAQGYGDAIYAALEETDADRRIAALRAIVPPEGGAPLRDLLLAAEIEDNQAAVDTLQALADAPGTPPLYRDLAALRIVLVSGGLLSVDERLARVEGLTGSTQAFRTVAAELRAALLIEAGRTEEAVAALRDIVADAGVSNGQRQRAAQLVVSLGGAPVDE